MFTNYGQCLIRQRLRTANEPIKRVSIKQDSRQTLTSLAFVWTLGQGLLGNWLQEVNTLLDL